MKNFLDMIFGEIDKRYLVRQYMYGAVVFVVLTMLFIKVENYGNIPYMLVCLVLYPFAMLVYDELMGLILGDTVLLVNGILALIWVLFKVLIIYVSSIFIAPIGIAILYFSSKKKG